MATSRRNQQNQNNGCLIAVIVFIAIALFLASLALIGYYLYQSYVPQQNTVDPALAYIDSRASYYQAPNEETFKNPGNMISYEIVDNFVFETAVSEGLLNFKSLASNTCHAQLYITLNDTNEVVLSTTLVAPGQIIKAAQLSLPVNKGEYEATATIYAIDSTSLERIGSVTQEIKVIVKS